MSINWLTPVLLLTATTNVERLVVVANNNANVASAVENTNIDASAVSNKFGLDVIVDRGTTNTIVGTAGADKVVIKGSFTTTEAGNGVNGDNHAAVTLFQGINTLIDCCPDHRHRRQRHRLQGC